MLTNFLQKKEFIAYLLHTKKKNNHLRIKINFIFQIFCFYVLQPNKSLLKKFSTQLPKIFFKLKHTYKNDLNLIIYKTKIIKYTLNYHINNVNKKKIKTKKKKNAKIKLYKWKQLKKVIRKYKTKFNAMPNIQLILKMSKNVRLKLQKKKSNNRIQKSYLKTYIFKKKNISFFKFFFKQWQNKLKKYTNWLQENKSNKHNKIYSYICTLLVLKNRFSKNLKNLYLHKFKRHRLIKFNVSNIKIPFVSNTHKNLGQKKYVFRIKYKYGVKITNIIKSPITIHMTKLNIIFAKKKKIIHNLTHTFKQQTKKLKKCKASALVNSKITNRSIKKSIFKMLFDYQTSKQQTYSYKNNIPALYIQHINMADLSNVSHIKTLTLNHINQIHTYDAYTVPTNYSPITTNIKINFETIKTNMYDKYTSIFILNFLENFVRRKIWLRIDNKNYNSSFWLNYGKNFYTRYEYLYKKYNKLVDYKQIVEILIITFKTQDLKVFLTFIKQVLEKNHFKKHKKILSIFFDIFRKNTILFTLTPVKGFSFDIRGKVGVSGNAKKRHIFFSHGKITNTTQNMKANFQQINVWTPTGQMGVTCIIQF